MYVCPLEVARLWQIVNGVGCQGNLYLKMLCHKDTSKSGRNMLYATVAVICERFLDSSFYRLALKAKEKERHESNKK